MAKEFKADVVVIGAGLTGLVAAFKLTKAGKKVYIVEKAPRTGGVINTVNEDGFAFETGPNSGVLSTMEAVNLFEELSGLCELEIANEESKKRLIWKGGSWQPLPSGPISAIGTPLFSFKDKLRILGEPFRKKGENPDESVAELVLRRLGRSFLDYAVDPFISGIYAGNPNYIITRYALPKLYNLEQDYGSFIGGSFKKMREPKPVDSKKVTRDVFSTKDGLKNLIVALEKLIGSENIFLNSKNVVIDAANKPYKTTFLTDEEITIASDKIITTVGGYALPEILPFIPYDNLKAIAELEYAKVVQAALGYKEWKGIKLDAFGGLVPSIEKRKVLGVLYSSSIFSDRAPEGGALLSVFLGGMRNPGYIDKSDEEIISIVLSEVDDMMKLNGTKPDLLKIFRYVRAIPQYGISSGERFSQIANIEKKYPGLILAGNIRDGIGMADRIKQAVQIAGTIINR